MLSTTPQPSKDLGAVFYQLSNSIATDRPVDASDVRAALALLKSLRASIGDADPTGIGSAMRSTALRIFTGGKHTPAAGKLQDMFGLSEEHFAHGVSGVLESLLNGTHVFARKAEPSSSSPVRQPRTQPADVTENDADSDQQTPKQPAGMNCSRRTFLGLAALTGGAIARNPAAAIAKLVMPKSNDLFLRGVAKIMALDLNASFGKGEYGMQSTGEFHVPGLDSMVQFGFGNAYAYGCRMLGLDPNAWHRSFYSLQPEALTMLHDGLADRGTTLVDEMLKQPSYYDTPAQWKTTLDSIRQVVPGMKKEMAGGLSDAIDGLESMLGSGRFETAGGPITIKNFLHDISWLHAVHERQLMRAARLGAQISQMLPAYQAGYDQHLYRELTSWAEKTRTQTIPHIQTTGSLGDKGFNGEHDLLRKKHRQKAIAELRKRGAIPKDHIDVLERENDELTGRLEQLKNAADPGWQLRERRTRNLSDGEWIGHHSYGARVAYERQKSSGNEGPDL